MGRLARWMLILQEFNFEVIHRPGAQHAIADYLSRLYSGEQPTGVDDKFSDAALFAVTNEEMATSPIEQQEWTAALPCSWYEEMFHFLNTG